MPRRRSSPTSRRRTTLMKTQLFTLFAALPLVALLSGCGGAMPMAAKDVAAPVAAAPPVLAVSLFAKDGTGALSEGDLQRVLSTPIDLQFPARIGVVPLAEPFNPHGAVSIGVRSTASRDLAQALTGFPHFSHV